MSYGAVLTMSEDPSQILAVLFFILFYFIIIVIPLDVAPSRVVAVVARPLPYIRRGSSVFSL